MGVIRIGIVDDELIDLVTAERFLRQVLKEQYPKEAAALKIDTFSRSEDIIAVFEPGMYDLLIMDIYMTGLSGLDAAEVIRGRDREVSIIFLTGSDEHLMAGYRVFADGYFIKPLYDHKEEFEETLRYVFPKLVERYKELTVEMGGLTVSIPYRNIRYIDIDHRHQVCLHTAGENISISSASYEECRQILLADKRFLECHHRILVNMDAIKAMKADDFILEDGEKIPISQRRKKEAKAKYMHYMVHR